MMTANRKTRPIASSAWSRRQFFTFSALATVASAFGFDAVARAAASKAAKATYQDNIYTRMFGVRPVVGAFETLSRYGNSKMSAEVLQAMAEALSCRFGAVWEIDQDGEAISCVETWCSPGFAGAGADFVRLTRESHFEPGVGLPGRVCCFQTVVFCGERDKEAEG